MLKSGTCRNTIRWDIRILFAQLTQRSHRVLTAKMVHHQPNLAHLLHSYTLLQHSLRGSSTRPFITDLRHFFMSRDLALISTLIPTNSIISCSALKRTCVLLRKST
jgi:hypothetical protein